MKLFPCLGCVLEEFRGVPAGGGVCGGYIGYSVEGGDIGYSVEWYICVHVGIY